jgi:hypothetical protein
MLRCLKAGKKTESKKGSVLQECLRSKPISTSSMLIPSLRHRVTPPSRWREALPGFVWESTGRTCLAWHRKLSKISWTLSLGDRVRLALLPNYGSRTIFPFAPFRPDAEPRSARIFTWLLSAKWSKETNDFRTWEKSRYADVTSGTGRVASRQG